jgi:hypothetical protein
VLGDLTAVLARQRPEQATHARGRPAPQIRPREDLPHLQQEVFQLISPLIRPLLVVTTGGTSSTFACIPGCYPEWPQSLFGAFELFL